MDIVAPLAQALAEHGLSLVIVIETLMSFVHLRNAHLSDRAAVKMSFFIKPQNSKTKQSDLNIVTPWFRK